MKTYSQLKEEVLNEDGAFFTANVNKDGFVKTATNEPSFVDRTKTAIMGKPTSDYSRYGMYSKASYGKTQGGLLGKGGTVDQVKKGVGNVVSNNMGLIGVGTAGLIGAAGLLGLLNKRRGRRDNQPQTTAPTVNLKTTKVAAPGSVGNPNERITRAPQRFDSNVRPIDNRSSRRA
jgi:hypothetical protein